MATGAQTNPFEEDRLNHSADYRRAWDVPSLNADASDWLTREVAALHDSPGISASRKIAVLLGPPGFGKTHLFGRVSDSLGQDVVFVFVPQILEEQLTRPLQHIRWHGVEALFEPAGNVPRITQVLAKLCRGSFEDYFDRLPDQLRARHQSLRQKLQTDSTAVLDILSPVKELPAYQRLADSMVAKFAHLPSDIVRAVVLGWSPASNDARRWLRGDDIAEAESKRLGLGDEKPSPIGVIKTIATLLQEVKLPLVICCDQLEAVMKDVTTGPAHFSNGLIQILQEIPNVFLIISCFTDKWESLGQYWVKAFIDRCYPPFELTPLTEEQAIELVGNRLKDWHNPRKGNQPTSPIPEASIRKFVRGRPQHPRTLVKVCRVAIDKFILRPTDPVIVDGIAEQTPLEDLFAQYWNEELAKIRGMAASPDDVQEDSLFQGITEALAVLQAGRQSPPGIEFRATKKGVVKSSPSDPRPSMMLQLAENGRPFSVILAVTKRDTGGTFTSYIGALDAALASKDVAGAVLVRPRLVPGVGKTTAARKKFDSLIAAQKLRPFALEQERLTFDILQCLLKVLKDADGKMIQLGGKVLSPDDCKKLIASTALLKSLKLFDLIFTGWSGQAAAAEPVAGKQYEPESARPAGRVTRAKASAPVASPVTSSVAKAAGASEDAARGDGRPASAASPGAKEAAVDSSAVAIQAANAHASSHAAASAPVATQRVASPAHADEKKMPASSAAVLPAATTQRPIPVPAPGTALPRSAGESAARPSTSLASASGVSAAQASAAPARPAISAPPSESRTWAMKMLHDVVAKLKDFGLPVKPLGVQIGPCFARLKVLPEDKTDINKVRRKDESLRVFLNLRVKPMIGFQAGYLSIDLELPKRHQVPLLPILKKRPPELVAQPAFPLGLDVAGKDHWLNLSDSSYCHLLIAGTTGSGKSELMKALLASLAEALTPAQLQIVLIDPKRVTFNFPGISPYFRAPIAHDPAEAIPLLQTCVDEMERRYKLLERSRKQNISELTGSEALPQIVLIFDEFADLMQDRESKKEMESHLKRLGAMARAAGIHLILGTQRTEASVVTPLLRSNLPGRISLKVTSERDSELILNDPGAGGLLGKGDLLWLRGGDLLRLQCPLVTPEQLDTLLKIE